MGSSTDTLTVTEAVNWQSGATASLPDNCVGNDQILSTAAIERSKLAQDTLLEYNVPFTALRVWDDLSSLLPGTAATDDLGLIDGTFGTDAPKVQAGDLKAAGATSRYCRFLAILPAEYVDAESVSIRVRTAMETTVADTTCTIDCEAFLLDKDGALDGSPTDLYTGAALDMNSLTAANKDFSLTDANLARGDILDVRLTIACNDAATGTAVTPSIYSIAVLADVKG